MKLSESDLKRFREALVNAFPAETQKLPIVVDDAGIGINFADYSGHFVPKVQTLLKETAGMERLTKLFRAAVKAAPDNRELREIKEYVDSYDLVIQKIVPPRGDQAVEQNLEQVLFTKVGFENAGLWLENLDRLRHRICRIEPQPRDEGLGGYGTGFLVGSDVILTNDHVARGLVSRAAKAMVRFDCVYDASGKATDGKPYALAPDYQILGSSVDQLDFALLRLNGKPAEDVVGATQRGYVIPTAYTFEQDEPLLILQHPLGEPLKLAFGSVSQRDKWASNRIAYRVNTDNGSSGSPCLTQGLEVGALHRQGADDHNSGVLASALIEFWSKDGQAGKLRATGLGNLVKPGSPVRQNGKTLTMPASLNTGDTDKSAAPETMPAQMPMKKPVEPILKKAFIIQSIGEEGTQDRERADRIFEDLIRPACTAAGFDAERGDKYSAKSITEPIISTLFGHPLAVADLGNLSSVSPSVMIEVGFRISTGRPLLFLADAPLPADVPPHLPKKGILAIDPDNPRASLDDLALSISACSSADKEQGKTQGWISEHPWVDWRLRLDSPSVYLNANEKAASLYGLDNVNEIIGQPVADVDERLYELMDQEYKEAFVKEQEAVIGRIIGSLNKREPLKSAAINLPLIFSNHPRTDMLSTIHLPVITNYKYDPPSSVVFRTVFLRIDDWCAKDLAERNIADRKLPALFVGSRHYANDFFLCYETPDFQKAQQLKKILTKSEFKVWWPSDQHTMPKDRNVKPDKLKTGLAQSRIAAVLVGTGDRERWGKGELDDALYKHCELRKPVIFFLLSGAPDNWLPPRYAEVLPEPSNLNWPDDDESVSRLLSSNTPASFLEQILAESAKLLRL